jgi:glycosyltransferase involved in cell wall biosynthesis
MEGYRWGGSEELWARAAVHLVQAGHHVAASVRHWTGPNWKLDELENAGIAIQRRRLSIEDFVDYVIAKSRRRPVRRPAGYGTFNRWMASQGPDLVCFSDGGFASSHWFTNACRAKSVPYVSLGQANHVRFWPLDEDLKATRESLAAARAAFFVSRENKELAELQIASRLPRAEVVWNPFNVPWDAAPPWPSQAGEPEVWRLACVARLEPQAKGQDIALQVLSQETWRTRPVQLTFYGSGPQEQGLKALVDMLGLQAKVRFAGHVADVRAIWAQNHALLLPSRYEGLPLALVEAMLCHRVPIVTAVAGNPDVVCDGVSGFLAEAPTLRHLDEAMERAWDQRTNWKAMGEVAGERIRQLVPQDPAADFAARLLTFAGKP